MSLRRNEKSAKHPGKGALRPGTVKRLLSYFAAYRVLMLFVFASILLSSLANVAAGLFLQRLIDSYIAPLLHMAAPSFEALLRALCLLGAICLVGVLSSWFYNRQMYTLAQKILKDVRDEMFARMQALPIGYFDKNTHGDLMSHYTNDTDALRQMLANGLPGMIGAGFTILMVFSAMLYLSLPLTGVVLLMLLLTFFLMRLVAGRSGAYFVRQQETLGDLNGYVEEMVHGQKVVKVFSYEEKAKAAFRAKNALWCENSAKAHGVASVMMPMMNALGAAQYVILAIAGGAMAVCGVTNLALTGFAPMSLGVIAAFLILTRSLTNPLGQIASQFNAIIMAMAGASRIFALMDEMPEGDEGYVTLVRATEADGILQETETSDNLWAWKQPQPDGSFRYTKLQGGVTFDSVDFGYLPETPVLHEVSLYAKPGQKIALVGATGAGKTTITNLINRFYDIGSGTITYDGINIKHIKKADLRRSLGMVLQDVSLFTGTVMENIRYGNPEAGDEDCIRAAKLANADRFITMLPEGYQTVLEGDGGGLSQGQRQLLSIARAAVSNPPVMILDEATSSVDTRTEALIQQAMDSLMEGRTVFVIAHRLSTVRDSKAILVMEQGRIIERGNHEELLEKGGVYYRLYTGAFELE